MIPLTRRVTTFSEFNNDRSDSDNSDRTFDFGQNTGVLLEGANNPGMSGPQIVGDILGRARAASDIYDSDDQSPPSSDDQKSRATSTLYFWKNGFSVDDGPLYSYDDPQNHDMLLSISRGRAPTSLFNVRYEQPIDIRAVGRLNRNYDPPEPVGNPSNYYGGIRLGDSRSPAQQSPSNSEDLREPKTIEVNESEPVVTVKIQLYQGTRLTTRLNSTHRIGELYDFVDSMLPSGYADREYILETVFPIRALSDRNMSVGEASIKGSVIIQKFL